MYWRYALLASFAALMFAPPSRAQPAQAGPSPFATEAIDRSVFREGEVRRFEGHFKSWRVVCDEVARLKQRFCSLSTMGADAAGRPVAALIVSTSDEGRPAALIHLPHGVALRQGLEVVAGPPAWSAEHQEKAPGKEKRAAKPKEKPGEALKLTFPSCDAQGCMTLWNLTPAQISALQAGSTLQIRFSMVPARNFWLTPQAGRAPSPVSVVVDGAGFGDAVRASSSYGSPQN
jgi:invasion protein IalB